MDLVKVSGYQQEKFMKTYGSAIKMSGRLHLAKMSTFVCTHRETTSQ